MNVSDITASDEQIHAIQYIDVFKSGVCGIIPTLVALVVI